MNRRDFLLLRRTGPERIVELSCERLYMRWADARSGAGGLEADEPPARATWEGEPPTEIETTSVEALFDELERALDHADTVRIRDHRWLSDAAFAAEVEARVEAFRTRGGKVE